MPDRSRRSSAGSPAAPREHALPPLNRLISVLAGAALVFGVLLLGWWYLAFSPLGGRPDEVEVAGLERTVRVRWAEGRSAHVEAARRREGYAGIGYVHGTARPWTALLLRQAALGRLAEWFDGSAPALDRWTRRLGFARTARFAYRTAPADRRARLEAYAAGFRAALQAGEPVDELLLLEVDPARWEPWHALAVHRLMAWLGTAPLRIADSVGTGAPVARWSRVDRSLRRWLHLHEFGNSRAWAADGPGGTTLVQQHVYGNTARVPFFPLTLGAGDREVELLSVPGTVLWPGGKDRERAWAVFLSSTAALEEVPEGSDPPAARYERIETRAGGEEVVEVRVEGDLLYLSSTWRLRWEGLDPRSAGLGWARAAAGDSIVGSFEPFDGNGLVVRRSGEARVLGTPVVRASSDGLTYAGDRPWAPFALRRLRGLRAGGVLPDADAQAGDTYSPWSDSVKTELVEILGEEQLLHPALREAATYLRNWDGTYGRASIGASIFDTWLGRYRAEHGRLPRATAPTDSFPVLFEAVVDSVRYGPVRLNWYRALRSTVDTLVRRYGTDPSRWRWELVQPDRRFYPAWSDSSFLPAHLAPLVTGRYAPLDPSGSGHPTALRWGGSRATAERPAPGAWTFAVDGAGWRRTVHRGRGPSVDRFLGRYLTTGRFGESFEVVLGGSGDDEVTLVPKPPARP